MLSGFLAASPAPDSAAMQGLTLPAGFAASAQHVALTSLLHDGTSHRNWLQKQHVHEK